MTAKTDSASPKTTTRSALGPSAGYAFDDDRQKVRAGDSIFFTYGIPPVRVIAPIIQRGKHLIALTPGHHPSECNLRRLRKLVGGWYRHNRQDEGSQEAK